MNSRLRRGLGAVTIAFVLFTNPQTSGNPLTNWTVSTIRPAHTNYSQGIVSLAHGNGVIVAGEGVADFGAVHTCRDTINWTLAYPVTGELNTPYSATFGGSLFVFAGWGGSISISSGGVGWLKRPVNSLPSGQQFFPTFWDVTYGGGQYVAVGRGDLNSIAYSLGGMEWYWANPRIPHNLDSVSYGNGFFLACGRTLAQYPESIVLQSRIGRSWTTNQISSNRLFSRIVFGNGIFVITGSSNGVPCSFVSADGTNWVQGSTSAGYDKLLYKYGLFWGFQSYQTTTTVSTSTNGLDWEVQGTLPPARAVTFAWDRMLLAAGTNVYRSDPLAQLNVLSSGTLRVSGVPGLLCAIQAASEIDAPASGWQTLTNLLLSTEPIHYTDPQATESTRRFYRAALLE